MNACHWLLFDQIFLIALGRASSLSAFADGLPAKYELDGITYLRIRFLLHVLMRKKEDL